MSSTHAQTASESMTYQPPPLRPNGFKPEVDSAPAETDAEALERLISDVQSDPEPEASEQVEPEPAAEAKPKRRRRSKAEMEAEREAKQPSARDGICVAIDGRQFAGTASDVALLLRAMDEAA